MRLFLSLAATLMALPFFSAVSAQTIALDKQDATVWAQEQVVSGEISGATTGTLYVDGAPQPFEAADGRFAVPVVLGEGETTFLACVAETEICAGPLRLTLGYRLRPEAELRASVSGTTVELTGEVIENPAGQPLAYSWEVAPDNPASLHLAITSDYTATTTIPAGAPAGEYYFHWTVQTDEERRRTVRTFVTVGDDGFVEAFSIEDDRAAWIDSAVVYGVAPYYFVRAATNQSQSFNAIRQKLPEIASLGVNTLWLQPVFASPGGGHSYDTSDYFAVASRLGTEEDLRNLISAAHDLDMRVVFDIPLNHTSILHQYAQDAIAHGPQSHYYDFYQREFDSAPYARHYHYRHEGEMTFVRYFWDNLPNLNYHNPEVRRKMIEASRYWVEEFNIDGYRVDAPWGMDARSPDFIPEWRAALKRIRPDILLLGEDKASVADRFDNRWDVAYDWADGESWVSQWMWQHTSFDHSRNNTIFNTSPPQNNWSNRLRERLTNFGQGWAPNASVFRFIENNDTFRFRQHHSLAQTRMAAALLFALPGMPLIYNGQEVGHTQNPPPVGSWQNWFATVYTSGQTIQSADTQGFFPYYQRLARLRTDLPSLTSDTFEELTVSPLARPQTFAFRRWHGDEHVLVAINMGGSAVTASVALPRGDMGIDESTTYFLTDLISGDATPHSGSDLGALSLQIPAHTTLIYYLGEEPYDLPAVSDEPGAPSLAGRLTLEPNYPNPFGYSTTIVFELPQAARARVRVFDILGREVSTVLDQELPAGAHAVEFDGSALASGVYVYVVEAGGEAASGRMVVTR